MELHTIVLLCIFLAAFASCVLAVLIVGNPRSLFRRSRLRWIVPRNHGVSMENRGFEFHDISYYMPPPSTVCPWEVEYQPNPVIFSGLLTRDDRRRQIETMVELQTAQVLGASATLPQASTARAGDGGETISDNSGSVDASHTSNTTPSASTPSGEASTSSYKCLYCNVNFSKRGQLNKHVNRKHTRRYQCELCNSAFHLNADLRRHERTVHRNELSGAVEEFTCPNAECPIPGKVFVRKDNFERHVRGCGRSTMDV